MMDAWSTCNVTIVKTSSMWKKVLWSNFPPMYWLPMLVASSFFCCCLILLWFCTLPALWSLLFYLRFCFVLFCYCWFYRFLNFWFCFVLFCFLILTIIHNVIFTNCFLYFWFCFVLLSFVIFLFYFVVISQPYMLSRHVRQQKNLQTACCRFFLFNLILHGQIWFFCADKGIRLKKLGTKSVSY